ncbi:hypothetical protein ACSFXN_19570 [Planococcus sp. 1R117A]|uniref:hypothetical protein n=1 Tax=Planococcus sp. 1R117A TaxID=3447020 RepID=UPI003EDC6F6A
MGIKTAEKTIHAPYQERLNALVAMLHSDTNMKEIAGSVNELIQLVQQREVRFYTTFISHHNLEHYKAYLAIFRRGKAKQIDKLQELLKEVNSKYPNKRFCLNKINLIFTAKSHEQLQVKMDKFVHNGTHKPNQEWITLI